MLDVPMEELLVDGELDLDPAGAGKYFTFQLKKAKLRLQARGFVGYVPINDRVGVDVTPRCPIANLARILRIAGFAPEVIERLGRRYAVDPTDLPNLRDFYAEVLLQELEQIQALGLFREYQQRVERTSSPRGRFVLGATETQLAATGWSPTVVASWFERTADTPANRCLKLAVWLLAQSYSQSRNPTGTQRRLARRLNAAYAIFADAELDARLGFLSDATVLGTMPLPSTRTYYRNALDVALLIVQSSSIALDRIGSDVHMPSVLIQLDKVFERYVRTLLENGLALSLPSIRVLDGNSDGAKTLFDSPPSEDANPDIVLRPEDWTEGDPTPAVLDVKYKPATGNPDRDDLNQIIAYAASYRAPAAVVVQPRAAGGVRHGLVRLGGIDRLAVYQYVIDLNADLDREERDMVETLGRFGEMPKDQPLISSDGQTALSFSV
jgi:5-methylcytosine-specific restriction enzyme subunit McrC